MGGRRASSEPLPCMVCGRTGVDLFPESMWCVSCVGSTLLEQAHLANDFSQDREVVVPGVGRHYLK